MVIAVGGILVEIHVVDDGADDIGAARDQAVQALPDHPPVHRRTCDGCRLQGARREARVRRPVSSPDFRDVSR